jgi:hypothetical protein
MTFEAMSRGAQAEQVADLKGRLLFLGFLAPPVDYSFDDRTETAVHQYQTSVGHHGPAGVVDESLWLQLCSDTDASGYTLQQALAGQYDSYHAEATVTVTGEHTDIEVKDIRQELMGLARDLNALTGKHVAGMQSACQYFQTYVNDRLANMDKQRYTGPDYLKYLTRHLVGEAGKEFTDALKFGLALTGVGAAGRFAITSIWIGCSMLIERKLGNAAKDAFADPQQTFGQAVPGLVARVTGEMTAAYEDAEKQFTAEINRVIHLLNEHKPLDKEVAWVEPLLHGDYEVNQQFIEHYVGIPTNWVAVRDALYKLLVEAFEDMVINHDKPPAGPFDAAAATMLAGAYGTTPDDIRKREQDDQHRRVAAIADDAVAKNLPHASHPQGH